MAICIVCVGILAILNDVLYVTDEDRFLRAMASIYDKDGVTFETGEVDSEFSTNASYGSVDSVTFASDGAVVVEATGTGGYGGNVTLYVVISSDATIYAWSIKEATGETLLANIKDAQQSTWYIGHNISTDATFDSDVAISGTTMTSRAISNAVNMAGYYARNALAMGDNPEADAKNDIITFLAGTTLADAEFTAQPASTLTAYNTDDASIVYAFTTTVSGSNYLAMLLDNDSILVLCVSADNLSVFQADDNVPQSNKDMASTYITSAGMIVDYTEVSGVYTITVIGYGGYSDGNVTLEVTVDATGSITALSITDNVDQSFIGNITQDILDGWYVGHNVAGSVALDDDVIVSNATFTSTAINNAINTLCEYASGALALGGAN